MDIIPLQQDLQILLRRSREGKFAEIEGLLHQAANKLALALALEHGICTIDIHRESVSTISLFRDYIEELDRASQPTSEQVLAAHNIEFMMRHLFTTEKDKEAYWEKDWSAYSSHGERELSSLLDKEPSVYQNMATLGFSTDIYKLLLPTFICYQFFKYEPTAPARGALTKGLWAKACLIIPGFREHISTPLIWEHTKEYCFTLLVEAIDRVWSAYVEGFATDN